MTDKPTLPPASSYAMARRGALLAPLALGGCSWLDNLFSEKKTILPGKREAVFRDRRGLVVDEGAPKVVLPQAVRNSGWPQSGGNPVHLMGHLEAADAPKPVWRADIGAGGGYRTIVMAQPVVQNGVVYVIDAEAVVSAFSLKDGQRLWKADTKRKADDDSTNIGSGLAVDGDTVYATNGLGFLIAMEASGGKEKWRAEMFVPGRASPTVADGRVFVTTIDERLTAYNAADGHPLWNHNAAKAETVMLGKPAPAYYRGLVIAGFGSGELVCVRADSGSVVWSDSLGVSQGRASGADLFSIRGMPVIANGLVYAISMGGLLVCNDVPTGRRVWERQVAGQDTPLIAGEWMFVISAQQELAAINITDGRISWISQLPHWEDPDKRKHSLTWFGPLLVSDRLIVTGFSGEALSVSPYTGEILGHMDLSDPAAPTVPVVADGTVLILTNDGRLTALR